MRWIRVKVRDLGNLTLPDACPNCLSPGAKTPIPLVRNLFVPGVGLGLMMKWRGNWCFCQECAQRFTLFEKKKRWFVFTPAVLLAFSAAYVAAMTRRPDMVPSAFWFLLAAVLVGVIGSFLITMYQHFSPKSESCISNFPTVRLIRVGDSFTGKRQWGDFYFCHPVYVEWLLAVNDSEVIKVNESALEKTRIAYQRRNS